MLPYTCSIEMRADTKAGRGQFVTSIAHDDADLPLHALKPRQTVRYRLTVQVLGSSGLMNAEKWQNAKKLKLLLSSSSIRTICYTNALIPLAFSSRCKCG